MEEPAPLTTSAGSVSYQSLSGGGSGSNNDLDEMDKAPTLNEELDNMIESSHTTRNAQGNAQPSEPSKPSDAPFAQLESQAAPPVADGGEAHTHPPHRLTAAAVTIAHRTTPSQV